MTPIRGIHQFREPPGRDRFLSVEEFQLLLAECKDPELRTAILVLCMTTLRLREPLKRQWSEIHLDGPAPYVSVPHTKKGKLAGWTGLEPATSDVTGRRSNQLNYHPARVAPGLGMRSWWAVQDSNL